MPTAPSYLTTGSSFCLKIWHLGCLLLLCQDEDVGHCG